MSAAEQQLNEIDFSQPDISSMLEGMDRASLDALPFGAVEFKSGGEIAKYNKYEQNLAGLSEGEVLGRDFFTEVAPCTNNYMVREKFADAWSGSSTLDETIDYVFSYKMKVTKVCLRMIVTPSSSWLLVKTR